MAPTIDIIRHAQASHNIYGNHIRDAILTEDGAAECRLLKDTYPFGPMVTNVISSPLRRAIDTAILGVLPTIDGLISIKLLPNLQEINSSPSSTGLPKHSLAQQYDGDLAINTDDIDEDWYHKDPSSPYAPQVRKVEARARAVRKHLRMLARMAIEAGKDDAHIVVVTHGEFAHWLTGDFQGVTETHNTNWYNTEYRSFQIDNIYAADRIDPLLVETTESIMGRDGSIFHQPINVLDMLDFKEIATRRVMGYSKMMEDQDPSPYETTDESDLSDEGGYEEFGLSEESDEWVDVDNELDELSHVSLPT
ncbi:histidine phosphatase superfamily [Daldinia grandis]|nr:histidine phosphatase superfamily [Daldinia grandis]